jgi:hypothetical protein
MAAGVLRDDFILSQQRVDVVEPVVDPERQLQAYVDLFAHFLAFIAQSTLDASDSLLTNVFTHFVSSYLTEQFMPASELRNVSLRWYVLPYGQPRRVYLDTCYRRIKTSLARAERIMVSPSITAARQTYVQASDKVDVHQAQLLIPPPDSQQPLNLVQFLLSILHIFDDIFQFLLPP